MTWPEALFQRGTLYVVSQNRIVYTSAGPSTWKVSPVTRTNSERVLAVAIQRTERSLDSGVLPLPSFTTPTSSVRMVPVVSTRSN